MTGPKLENFAADRLREHEIETRFSYRRAYLHGMSALEHYDRRGVRAFVTYAANGKFGIDCYRKNQQPKNDADWKMIKVTHLETYATREEATKAALGICAEVCKKYGY